MKEIKTEVSHSKRDVKKHLFYCRLPHQCMEGGDREDTQAAQGGFGGAAGDCQQALWVGQLSTL